MIEYIVSLLKNNKRLVELIGENNIYPIQTNYLGDCVIYDAYTTSHNKIIQETRLQITIIADKLSTTLAIEQEIEKILLTLGDTSLNNTILQVEANGGGSLYDNSRRKNHRIVYFNIISRSEL